MCSSRMLGRRRLVAVVATAAEVGGRTVVVEVAAAGGVAIVGKKSAVQLLGVLVVLVNAVIADRCYVPAAGLASENTLTVSATVAGSVESQVALVAGTSVETEVVDTDFELVPPVVVAKDIVDRATEAVHASDLSTNMIAGVADILVAAEGEARMSRRVHC